LFELSSRADSKAQWPRRGVKNSRSTESLFAGRTAGQGLPAWSILIRRGPALELLKSEETAAPLRHGGTPAVLAGPVGVCHSGRARNGEDRKLAVTALAENQIGAIRL